MTAPEGVLLLFLDGVGIGPDDPRHNPFFGARLPILRELLGGEPPSLGDPRRHGGLDGRAAASVPLDARLSTDGVPQSGTGQTALLTGINAAHRFGRHFGPWVPVRLRPLVEQRSVLSAVQSTGRSAAFANAYPAGWPGPRGSRRVAAPPLAARGAGLLTRDERHLRTGEAVASEILNTGWRRHLGFRDLPDVTAAEAGRTLAGIAAAHSLTLFAHYSTDTAGHGGEAGVCRKALERVDAFVGGLLERLPARHLLVIASDHGNIEDLSRRGHTLHPALGLVAGPDAVARAGELGSLLDVAPAILRWLEAA